jgi:hypothetical protein
VRLVCKAGSDVRAENVRSSAHLVHLGVRKRRTAPFFAARSCLTRRVQTQFGDAEAQGGGRRRVGHRGQGRGKRGGGEAQAAAMSTKQLGKTIRCVAASALCNVP